MARKNPVIDLGNGVSQLVLLDAKGRQIGVSLIDTANAESILSVGFWGLHHHPAKSRLGGSYPYVGKSLGRGGNLILHRFLLSAPRQMDVDHLNGDTLDNRRENIRLATKSENQQNTIGHRDSKSGLRNVYKRADGMYQVQVCINYKRHSGGMFWNVEEAAAAAEALRRKLHPFCPEHTGRVGLAVRDTEKTPCRAAVAEAARMLGLTVEAGNGRNVGLSGKSASNPWGPVIPAERAEAARPHSFPRLAPTREQLAELAGRDF